MNLSNHDRDLLQEFQKLVTKLEIDNWKKYHECNEYAKGKDRAYREVIRLFSNELNK